MGRRPVLLPSPRAGLKKDIKRPLFSLLRALHSTVLLRRGFPKLYAG
jgi:hypothetical protein